MVNEHDCILPAYTKGVPVRLNMKKDYTLNHNLAFFQPSGEATELGLMLEATPSVEVKSRAVYILFNNGTATDITIPRATSLGWLISQKFHDFDLTRSVIGTIPPNLLPTQQSFPLQFTVPSRLIAITSVVPVEKDTVSGRTSRQTIPHDPHHNHSIRTHKTGKSANTGRNLPG